MLPPSVASSTDAEKLDGLVHQTAERLANVIEDFKRDVSQGEPVTADGTITIRIGSRAYVLTVAHDQDRERNSVHVQTRLANLGSTNSPVPLSSVGPSSDYITTPQQPQSITQVAQNVISPGKRRFEDSPDICHKRPRTDNDVTSLISKEDLDDLLSTLRDDIRSNTKNSINHVQGLLRRFKQEVHNDGLQMSPTRTPAPVHDSSASNGMTSDASFPAASVNLDAKITTITNVVRQEAKLVSKQIRWVDDCRRVAADIHDEREEMWRTSAAGFHDRQRKNREEFQDKMLHESELQSRVLKDILDQVRRIGGCAQDVKSAQEACSTDSRSSTAAPPEEDLKRGRGPDQIDVKKKSPT